MRITALIAQKNNPKRINLYIDEKFTIGISLQLAVESKLSVNKNLSVSEIENLLLKINSENLFDIAVNFLSYRPRTRRELVIHLKKKITEQKIRSKLIKISPPDTENLVNAVCEKLERLGFLNEKEFILWWVDQRQKHRQKSLWIIKSELLQKGLDKKIIDEVITDNKAEVRTDFENAMTLSEKRLKRISNLSLKLQKESLFSYLRQRGFGYELIQDVIDRICQKT